MDFNEFCEKTKKVKILSSEDDVKKYDELYLFNPEYNKIKPVNLHGLYFLNDDEIRNLCRRTNSNNFMLIFRKEINVKNFENNPFAETEEFLKSKKGEDLYLKENTERLTDILGRAYTSRAFKSAELLDSDIRIKALRIFPEINVISYFKKIQIGYIGVGFAVPDINK